MLRQAQHDPAPAPGREGGDCRPRLVARPAGAPEAAGFDAAREAYARGPHPELVEGFPSTARLIEMNRQAAAQAFSGYLPRMILMLIASAMAATACVMLIVELYRLDARLAGCV